MTGYIILATVWGFAFGFGTVNFLNHHQIASIVRPFDPTAYSKVHAAENFEIHNSTKSFDTLKDSRFFHRIVPFAVADTGKH